LITRIKSPDCICSNDDRTCSECFEYERIGKQRYDLLHSVYFGNILMGVWSCTNCGFNQFPSQVSLLFQASFIKWNGICFICPKCSNDMIYDEEA